MISPKWTMADGGKGLRKQWEEFKENLLWDKQMIQESDKPNSKVSKALIEQLDYLLKRMEWAEAELRYEEAPWLTLKSNEWLKEHGYPERKEQTKEG